MGLADFFSTSEPLIAIDIGSSSVKLIELDISGETPSLLSVGIAPIEEEVFANNQIEHMELVSELVAGLMESNAVGDKRVATAMPGPSVFTKKIKMPRMEMGELRENIQFEAGGFIPHNIENVRLDFHILGKAGKKQLEILVVAVKNEIIDSFIDSFSMAGLETAVVDVDYFALQNVFEMAHPDLVGSTVALVNIGDRFTSINICKGGSSLFTGDISVGGRSVTETLMEELEIDQQTADKLKRGKAEDHPKAGAAKEIVDRVVEETASELNRQISFFWNASGSEEGIDHILLSGGGALLNGIVDEVQEKTGIDCRLLEGFNAIECGENFDAGYLKEIGPLMSVCLGLGIRQPGDKEIPDYV